MLINFSIKNFRSFKELATLDLETSDSKPLAFAAIFGPNASGKSNLFQALAYIQFAVQNTNAIKKQTVASLQPFRLDKTSRQEPSFFELTLLHVSSDTTYRYGFEVNNDQIISEWLVEDAIRAVKHSERVLFTRSSEGITFHSAVPQRLQILKDNIAETILALSYLANNNYAPARMVAEMIVNDITLVDCSRLESIGVIARHRMLEDPELKNRVIAEIKKLDVGIQDLAIEEVVLPPDKLSDPSKQFRGVIITTAHQIYDKGLPADKELFDLASNESAGTQKLVWFMAMLIEAMEKGWTVVADEFDSSFHPFIVAALIKFFTANKEHNAQIIALTHETYLLTQKNGLKRDQIWFTEKSRTEESSLTCLAEYTPRSDAQIEKQYLEGRFGAVPIILSEEETN